MKAFTFRAAMLVAGLALTAGPALAQKAGPGGGGNGGNGGGGANTNAGGGGATAGANSVASSSSSTSGGTTTSSGGGFSGGSSGGFGPSSPSSGRGEAMRSAAPEHRTSLSYSMNTGSQPQRTAPTSTPSRSSGSQPAAPRASSGSPSAGSNPGANHGGEQAGNSRRANDAASGANASHPRSDESHAVPRASGSIEAAANNPAGNREVPSWSRNRGDRASTGTAVPRSPDNPPPGHYPPGSYGRSGYGYYDPFYYDPYGVYGYYGFAGGYYGFSNPYYSPYGFGGYGLDPGFGNPYYGDPTDPYMYGDGYGSYSSRIYNGEGQGALKLKVKPRTAKVYVDGYFVGNVDQFDGMMQKLTLNGGGHKVEVKADGYETAEFDVLITPGKTLTFSGDLKKLQ
jgi:hypothetical protein